jgi:hypothetical protein
MIPMVLIWLNALHVLAERGHEMTRHGWQDDIISLLPASIDVAQSLAASHDGGNHEFPNINGGFNIPPVPMA